MNENAIDRKLVCAFIAGLISDDVEREKGLEYIRSMPPVNPQPCEDAISRQAVLDVIKSMSNVNPSCWNVCDVVDREDLIDEVEQLLPVIPQPKTEHCKDCKHFEYDSVARVDGIPLIVAHEICSRWGDGCKTSEDGYCFLFEPQERSDKE